MFEKEAEEIVKRNVCEDCNRCQSHGYIGCDIYRYSKDSCLYGLREGYNKANEWHYVKDGDLPKDEDYKWCISSNGIYYVAKYEELFLSWTNQEHKEVCCPYAWKEIVQPKEVEK